MSNVYIKLDGTVWTWNFDKNTIPVKVDIENVKQISVAINSFYAVTEDGTLWGWGNNDAGELGIKTDQKKVASPIKIMDNVERVYGSYSCAYAIKKDRSLWFWGSVSLGFYASDISTPVRIMDDVVKVSGHRTIAIIKKDNSLWLCGYNQNNLKENGFNAIDRLDVPIKVLGDVVDVNILGENMSALKKDGTLWHCRDYNLMLWGIGNINLNFSFENILDYVAIPGSEGVLASSWARDDISRAIEEGLVPDSLQSEYKNNITRGDFALLIAALFEKANNKDLDILVK